MPPVRVREYPVWEIEEKAESLLREAYRTVYPYTVPATAVKVDWVAERTLGLSFRSVPGLRSLGVDGLLLLDRDGRPAIVVDRGLFDHLNEHRYRFTVAEEVGHYVLHFRGLPRVATPADAIRLYLSIENRSTAERNAKRFAAALLMPMESFERQAAGIYAGVRESPTGNTGEELVDRLVALLVKIFRVSPEAVRYRLTEYPARLMDRIQIALREGLATLPPRSQ
ncbi:MAG: ImmA/IrrE family metallo-endopeptidase [Planctomycetes bacterium]|nr:ImmA/IrrE family metallo-endopeptidase [Planctomycetota bacterium]